MSDFETIYTDDDVTVTYDPRNIGNLPVGIEPTFRVGVGERVWLSTDAIDAIVGKLTAGKTAERTNAEEVSFNEAQFRLAAIHERVAYFRYVKSSADQPATRRLAVWEVSTSKDGHTIITGNDPDRDDVRAYRLDRVQGDVVVQAE